MYTSLKLNNALEIVTQSDDCRALTDGYILSGKDVAISLLNPPAEYYIHGWQSWSLTAWVSATHSILPTRPYALHPLQADPVYAFEEMPNGSHLAAVKMPDGLVLLLGAIGLETHTRLNGHQLEGWSETNSTDWFFAYGLEEKVFKSYAHQLEKIFGITHFEHGPRMWCSWYSLFTDIYEEQLLKILANLGDLPFDVFQIDDGWQKAIGDWKPNVKFPGGIDGMATKIRASGRQAGLWLAPLLVVPSSQMFREHADWLLRDEKGKLVSAGFNWNEKLYALDTTHPDALEWLAALMKKVRAWGYDFAKLDFLYAGALPGKRHNGMAREAAYRHGLGIIREALGDAYLLACGAPVIPSLGLCDGLRIGPDVASGWASERDDLLLNNFTTPGGRNGVRTSLNRLWLVELVNPDPDVVYFRTKDCALSGYQKHLMQDLAKICRFIATSDVPAWWTEAEREQVRAYLEAQPEIKREDRHTFQIDERKVDFSPHIHLPKHSLCTKLLSKIVGPASDSETIRKIDSYINQVKLKKTTATTK